MKKFFYKNLSLLILVVCIVILSGLVYFAYNLTKSRTIAVVSETQSLTGKLVYFTQDNSVNIYDFLTGKSNTIFTSQEPAVYSYSDGFVFAFVKTSKKFLKIDISGKILSEVAVNSKDYDISFIKPSPDGEKLLVYLVQSGMGSTGEINQLLITDFHEGKVIADIQNLSVKGEIQWFSDSKFVYIGGSVLNLSNLSMIKLANPDIFTTISLKGYGILQFPTSTEKFKYHGFAYDTSRELPFLRYRTLGFYLPNDKELNKTISESILPFFMFPIPGRDFQNIDNIVAGAKQNEFFVEIDDGEKEIFFTDSSGTFKKISPQDGNSYKLLKFLPEINKAAAIKIKNPAFNEYKYTLILLDPGNYSEFNADIPKKNFSTVVLFDFGKNLPNFYDKSIQVSPDMKYLLFPNKNNSEYIVTTIDGKLTQTIKGTFGYYFFWIK